MAITKQEEGIVAGVLETLQEGASIKIFDVVEFEDEKVRDFMRGFKGRIYEIKFISPVSNKKCLQIIPVVYEDSTVNKYVDLITNEIEFALTFIE